jgi:hypothetical protein
MAEHSRGHLQAAGLARHLNLQHPSTVLLLARHAPGGRPDVQHAELVQVDDAQLTMTAATPDGSVELHVPLPEGADPRARLRGLLANVRTGRPDDEPLTTLEIELELSDHPRHGRPDA